MLKALRKLLCADHVTETRPEVQHAATQPDAKPRTEDDELILRVIRECDLKSEGVETNYSIAGCGSLFAAMDYDFGVAKIRSDMYGSYTLLVGGRTAAHSRNTQVRKELGGKIAALSERRKAQAATEVLRALDGGAK